MVGVIPRCPLNVLPLAAANPVLSAFVLQEILNSPSMKMNYDTPGLFLPNDKNIYHYSYVFHDVENICLAAHLAGPECKNFGLDLAKIRLQKLFKTRVF